MKRQFVFLSLTFTPNSLPVRLFLPGALGDKARARKDLKKGLAHPADISVFLEESRRDFKYEATLVSEARTKAITAIRLAQARRRLAQTRCLPPSRPFPRMLFPLPYTPGEYANFRRSQILGGKNALDLLG